MSKFSNSLKSLLCLVIVTLTVFIVPSYQTETVGVSKENALPSLEQHEEETCFYGTVSEVLEFTRAKVKSISQKTEYYKVQDLNSLRNIAEAVLTFEARSLSAKEENKESSQHLKEAVAAIAENEYWLKALRETSFEETSSETERVFQLIWSSLDKAIVEINEKEGTKINAADFLTQLRYQRILNSLEARYKSTLCLPYNELETTPELVALVEEMKQLNYSERKVTAKNEEKIQRSKNLKTFRLYYHQELMLTYQSIFQMEHYRVTKVLFLQWRD